MKNNLLNGIYRILVSTIAVSKDVIVKLKPQQVLSDLIKKNFQFKEIPQTIKPRWANKALESNVMNKVNFNQKMYFSNGANEHSQGSSSFKQKINDFITYFGLISGSIGLSGWSYSSQKEKEYEKLLDFSDIKQMEKQYVERFANSELSKKITNIPVNVKLCAIIGDSGSGKTQIVNKYSAKYYETMLNESPRQKRTSKFFHADNLAVLKNDYMQFAKDLGIDIRNRSDEGELIREVNKILSIRKDWLLVFDNVNDYQEIIKYIPSGEEQKGQVLLTMQSMPAGISPGQVFDLNNFKLTKGEAIELFDNARSSNTENSTDKLILFNKLGFSPLAIKLAAGFMKERQETIQTFLQRQEIQLLVQSLSSVLGLQAVENIILRTIKPTTRGLLSYLVFFNIDAIEQSILDDLAHNTYGLIRPEDIKLATIELEAYNLLERQSEYKIHRSLKEIVLTTYNKKNILEKLIKYFKASVVDVDYTKLEQKAKIPHFQVALNEFRKIEQNLYVNDKKIYGELATYIAYILDGQANYYTSSNGDIQTASKLLEEAKSYIEKLIQDSSILTAKNGEKICELLGGINKELPGVYARVLYSLGRKYFYEKDKTVFMDSKEYFELSKAITDYDLVQTPYGKLKRLDTMLVESNGLLYLALESNNRTILREAVKRYGELLVISQNYVDKDGDVRIFENGLIKNPKGNQNRRYHHSMCHRQLARAYLELTKLLPYEESENLLSYPTYAPNDDYYKEAFKNALTAIYIDPTELKNLSILADIMLVMPTSKLGEVRSQFSKNNELFQIISNCQNNIDLAKAILTYISNNEKAKSDEKQHAKYQLSKLNLEHYDLLEAKEKIEDTIFIQQTEMKRSAKHPELKEAYELQSIVQSNINTAENEYSKLQSVGVVEVWHMSSVYQNPILNDPNIETMLRVAKQLGGVEAINQIIDLGSNHASYTELANNIKLEGVENAITKLLSDVRFQVTSNSKDKTTSLLINNINNPFTDQAESFQNDNNVVLTTQANTETYQKNLFDLQTLTISSFTIKEMIEVAPSLKYFAKEVLGIQHVFPRKLQELELPELTKQNYFWIGIHYAAGTAGAFTLPANNIGLTIKMATPIASTSVYGSKLAIYDALLKQKQVDMQSGENKSINSPSEFLEKCSLDIAAYSALSLASNGINKIMLGMPLSIVAYDMLISASLGGIQCYSTYQQIDNKENTLPKTITENVLPSIADAMILYTTTQNMHFDFSRMFTSMLSIKQGLATVSTVVITDQMTKLLLSANREILNNIEKEYIGKIFSTIDKFIVGVIGTENAYFNEENEF